MQDNKTVTKSRVNLENNKDYSEEAEQRETILFLNIKEQSRYKCPMGFPYFFIFTLVKEYAMLHLRSHPTSTRNALQAYLDHLFLVYAEGKDRSRLLVEQI